MAQTYRIREGSMFVLHDGTRLIGPCFVDLEHDVAQVHAQKLEPVPPTVADAPADVGSAPDPEGAQP